MYVSPNVNLASVASAASMTTALADLATLLVNISAARGALIDRLSIITAGGAGELTAARAALLTNLNATITSRLGAISSVQRGSIAIGGGNTSGTATISAVTLARSVLYHLGNMRGSIDGSGDGQPIFRVELTNTTTVTASATIGPANGDTIGYQVVEFAA